MLETHTHADHVSGHGRLAAATGAVIHVHREADAEYPHEPFDDGWELRLGTLRVTAVHTPGHRPEHTAFLLTDTARGEEPWAVLTGDSLFVGDVARPDLAVDRVEGARGIFRSLHERLLTLADDVEIWPGHLGGSMCGGPGMDLKVASTIGYERTHNAAAGRARRGRVRRAGHRRRSGRSRRTSRRSSRINRGPLHAGGVDPPPLTPRQVEHAREAGALLVDVRTDLQFDDAHAPGAVCITALRAGFGTRLAWIADREQDIVLIGRDDDDALHAAELAAAVGVTRLAGRLAGGMTSWREERRPVQRIERLTVDALHERLADEPDLQVARRARAARSGTPGTSRARCSRPTTTCARCPTASTPSGRRRPSARSGQRSGVAASLLQGGGASGVIHVVDGGVGTWRDRGWPIETGASTARP